MFVSHEQNAGQNHNTKVNNKSSENVVKVYMLGKLLLPFGPKPFVSPSANRKHETIKKKNI